MLWIPIIKINDGWGNSWKKYGETPKERIVNKFKNPN